MEATRVSRVQGSKFRVWCCLRGSGQGISGFITEVHLRNRIGIHSPLSTRTWWAVVLVIAVRTTEVSQSFGLSSGVPQNRDPTIYA